MELLPVPDIRSGIYFLRDETGRIIYIGKSKDVTSRTQEHSRFKTFHDARYVPYPVDVLNEKEWQYIHLLTPEGNVLDNPAHQSTRRSWGGRSPYNTGIITLSPEELQLIEQIGVKT